MTAPALTTTDNPYWNIIQQNPGGRFSTPPDRWRPDPCPIDQDGQIVDGHTRSLLAAVFSWAIPSPAAIDWMILHLAGRPLVEVGAGTGYWAALLAARGVRVDAYDKAPPATVGANAWHSPKKPGTPREFTGDPGMEYLPITRGGPEVLQLFSNHARVLFLCWPPYDTTFGAECIAAFQGDTLIYCGEGDGGCCGDDDMFKLLGEEWVEVDRCADHVQWDGLHDELIVFLRRPAGCRGEVFTPDADL